MRNNFKIYSSLLILVLVLNVFFTNFNIISANQFSKEYGYQSAREIPIIKKVDVVIIGGTAPAVSAAISASEKGASVFLIAPRPYLGEDMCATLRLEIDKNRILKTNLEKQIFGREHQTTPLKVKATLNKALLEANVEFVYGSFVTDVLWNDGDVPAGIIIANRAGRQAIIAKTIIDATHQGWVCRMAGAKAVNWSGSEIEFERTIILSGSDNKNPDHATRKLKIEMPDLHFPSFAQAEQIARKKTYTEELLRGAESLFYIPPDPVICKKNSQDWNNMKKLDIDFFQPEGFDNLFVLSASAGIPRSIADSLLKPTALCEVGEITGKAAAQIAMQQKISTGLLLKNEPVKIKAKGNVKEILIGLRPVDNNLSSIKLPETSLPLLSNYDIVVVGGGTSGAPAAISAARMGMKVLVVEYQEGLGGVGTLGLIGKPYHGRNVGFAAEVPFPKDNIEPKMEWYRSEIEKAGGDIWLGVLGCGAYVEGTQVKGAVISTPEGRFMVKANVVIDATGNADIAIAAGAEYMYGDIENGDIALQGTGFPSRPLSGNYLNTDYLLVNEMDMIDVWRTLLSVHKTKYEEGIFDAGTLFQNRERHRIVGDFVMNYLDQVIGRTYPDAIVYSGSDYDSHGYPSSPYFALLPHDEISRKENHPAPSGTCYTPYRSLIPKNLDGILVTGLGISMERDASAMVRMQLDLANQGYAAGVAATLAITSGKNLREIDIKELQQYLVDKGNLPEEVLKLKDSFPFSKETIQKAVLDYGKSTNPKEAGIPLALILTHKKTALPLVGKEYKKSTGKKKLHYAQVLGMCGKKEGVKTLLNELDQITEWDEKIFQGSMADFAHLPTPQDAIILALGNSGDKTVIPQLIRLVEKLDTNVTLSHHRSLALALEKLADPKAAQSIAELLQKPGMQGHAIQSIEVAYTGLDNDGKGPNPVKNSSRDKRTKALREIVLARALYKCGDYNGVGENILNDYTKDMRGLFAQHANQILQH
ncbi:FAD-dependent oxidoreductase [Draconibacterium sp.]|nr:FAD-dependent oxidoreductase [Draconibacterium sp.]